ncbi:MAG: hypothetical protein LUQ07_04170 [Methanospirillum sp.]|nr:hypothetical protein [Methanospirillum sp.]
MTAKCTFWFPALLTAGICIAITCGLVSAASPQLPCEFYGSVSIQGSPAPAGTVISAYVNGNRQGDIQVTTAGQYGGTGTFDERLIVMANETDFEKGAPSISFQVNGNAADQTAVYSPGSSNSLNLTIGGQTSVIAPAPVSPVPVQPVLPANETAPVIVAQTQTASAPVPVTTPDTTVSSPVVVASFPSGNQTTTTVPTGNYSSYAAPVQSSPATGQ